jgi:arginine decarboxylase-like protein
MVRELDYTPEELQGLESMLSDTYFCNFSIFQSMPDSWAIKQLFPIMPIHRLTENPTRKAVLGDITCDSDGKIDQFIDLRDVRNTLQLHEVSLITWGLFFWAPIRKSWAIFTTSLATPMRFMLASMKIITLILMK